MSNETFRGRPVLFYDDDSKVFCFDLFNMINDSFGPHHFMKADNICAYHYGELLKRIADLIGDVECGEWVTIGLGDEPSDDESAAVLQGNARA